MGKAICQNLNQITVKIIYYFYKEGKIRGRERKALKCRHCITSLLSSHRDQLIKTQRQLYLRQRTLISELSQTFCIQQMNDTFTICGVILPNGDPLETGRGEKKKRQVKGACIYFIFLQVLQQLIK